MLLDVVALSTTMQQHVQERNMEAASCHQHVAGNMLLWNVATKQFIWMWMLNMLQIYLQKELCYNAKLLSAACLLSFHKLKRRNSNYDQASLKLSTDLIFLNRSSVHTKSCIPKIVSM